jgi:hypothetical protein
MQKIYAIAFVLSIVAGVWFDNHPPQIPDLAPLVDPIMDFLGAL